MMLWRMNMLAVIVFGWTAIAVAISRAMRG
jgi:hypothetical protein